MVRLSVQVPALVAAWDATHDARYARHAEAHLRAWFIAPATRMNPNLRYAQAIHGLSTGAASASSTPSTSSRSRRALERLRGAPGWTRADAEGVRRWFADTSPG